MERPRHQTEVSMAHIAQVGTPLVMVVVLAGGCGGSDGSRGAGAETGAAADSAAAKAASGPRHISNVMIGKRIGSGNRMTDPTFQFAPQDTVYLSVATEGSSGPDKVT